MLRGTVLLHLQIRRRKMEVLCCCDMYVSMWYQIPSLSDRFVRNVNGTSDVVFQKMQAALCGSVTCGIISSHICMIM